MHREVTIQQLCSCSGSSSNGVASQSSYVHGAAELSWETISALLKEKASGIAIAIRSSSLRTVLVPSSDSGLQSDMLQGLGIVNARAYASVRGLN